MKKAISYMACSMAAMLALSSCGSAASSASTVASSSDAASTESTAASEASNEPVTITFAQYSGSGDNEQYLQQMVDCQVEQIMTSCFFLCNKPIADKAGNASLTVPPVQSQLFCQFGRCAVRLLPDIHDKE